MHLALIPLLALCSAALTVSSVDSPTRIRRAGPPTLLPLPTITTCRPANISWTGGTPPYTLFAFPSYLEGSFGLSAGSERFTDIYATWFVWLADVAFSVQSGVDFKVTDANLQDSNQLHVIAKDSGDSSCLAFSGYTSVIGSANSGFISTAAEGSSSVDSASPTSGNPAAASESQPGQSAPSNPSVPGAGPTSSGAQSSASSDGSASSSNNNAGQTDRGTIIAGVVSGVLGLIGAVVAAVITARCMRQHKREREEGMRMSQVRYSRPRESDEYIR